MTLRETVSALAVGTTLAVSPSVGGATPLMDNIYVRATNIMDGGTCELFINPADLDNPVGISVPCNFIGLNKLHYEYDLTAPSVDLILGLKDDANLNWDWKSFTVTTEGGVPMYGTITDDGSGSLWNSPQDGPIEGETPHSVAAPGTGSLALGALGIAAFLRRKENKTK